MESSSNESSNLESTPKLNESPKIDTTAPKFIEQFLHTTDVEKESIPSYEKFLTAWGLKKESELSLVTRDELDRFEVKYKSNPENKDFVLLPKDAAAICKAAQYGAVLKLNTPKDFLGTSGKDWAFQQSEENISFVRNCLPQHYKLWAECAQSGKEMKEDQKLHPIFLLFGAPGTGKSRNLQNFPELCISNTKDLVELNSALSSAYVFHVNFENGTKTLYKGTGDLEIGIRMMYQLSGYKPDFGEFAVKPANQKTPTEVLKIACGLMGKKREECSFFILIDGVHELPPEELKRGMYSIADLVNGASSFVVAAFAGTYVTDVQAVLQNSPQLRIYLNIRPVDGKLVYPSKDPLINLLIDDMGGHGRALEALVDELKERGSIDNCSLGSVMNSVLHRLAALYPNLKAQSPLLIPALIAVLTRYKLTVTGKVPGMDITVDRLLSYGLFRLTNGYLTCPFIILWLLATWSNNPSLSLYKLDTYNELQHNQHPLTPLGVQCWQHWEHVTADFRVLKSVLLNGMTVTISELHQGAIFNEGGTDKVKVKQLRKCQATAKVDTSDRRLQSIEHEMGKSNLKDCDSFIINGGSASASDSFCGITLEDGSWVRELHQNKHYQKTQVTTDLYLDEYKKSSKEGDIFLLFTTGKADKVDTSKLPSRCGLVSKENFEEYFGPYAARAFAANTVKIGINDATRSQLTALHSIGEGSAEIIINKRPFANKADFVKKVKKAKLNKEQMAALEQSFIFPENM